MGNVPAGNDISLCLEYDKSPLNTKIEQSLPLHFEAVQGSPLTKKPPVLLAYTNPHEHSLVIVHSFGAEAFNLISGEKSSHAYTMDAQHYITYGCLVDDNLVVALNNGLINILDKEMLFERKQITPSALLPGIISHMIPVKEGVFLTGHTSGEIKVWSIEEGKEINSFESSLPPTAVLSLAYSKKHDMFAVGYDNRYPGGDKPLDTTKVNVLSLETSKLHVELLGLTGKCLGLKIMESNNIVIGLGLDRCLILWDIIGGFQLIKTSVPTQISEAFPFSLFKVFTCLDQCFLVFGFADSTIGVSELVFEGNEMKYVFVWRAKSCIWKKTVISSVYYDTELDCFVIGDSKSNAHILNNISEIQSVPQAPTPLFSLKSHTPQQKPRERVEDLPILSIGNLKVSKAEATAELKEKFEKNMGIHLEEDVEELDNTDAQQVDFNFQVKQSDQTEPITSEQTTESNKETNVHDVEDKKFVDIPMDKTTEEPTQKTENPTENEKARQNIENKQPEEKKVDEKTLEKIRERVEGKAPNQQRKLTPFENFLKVQKPKLLEGDPSLTHKVCVMQVSAMWASLTEQEKKEYEESKID